MTSTRERSLEVASIIVLKFRIVILEKLNITLLGTFESVGLKSAGVVFKVNCLQGFAIRF